MLKTSIHFKQDLKSIKELYLIQIIIHLRTIFSFSIRQSLLGIFLVFFLPVTHAQNMAEKTSLQILDRVEPPHWWVGMQQPELQLMVYGKDIGKTTVKIDYAGASISKTTPGKSANYLFIDLFLKEGTKAGILYLQFFKDGALIYTHPYQLKERLKDREDYTGFDYKDAIYLITPDRFANGNPDNDRFNSLAEKEIDRTNDYARHGGCLLYTSPSPRDLSTSRMPSSA